MTNNEIIELTIKLAPELEKAFIEDYEFYEGLSYVFYGSEVFPYMKNLLIEKKIEELNKFILFFEEWLGKDDYFDNIIYIQICESIFYDEYIEEFKKLLPPKLLDGVKYFEEEFDKSPEWFDEINAKIAKMKSQN
ncbi:MAG: DUF7674 family protein [Mycoplasmatales bacterium]